MKKFCLPALSTYQIPRASGQSRAIPAHVRRGDTGLSNKKWSCWKYRKKRMIYTQLSPECLLVKKTKWDQEIRTNYKYKQHQNIRNNIFNQPNNLNHQFNQEFLLLFPSLKCMLGGINNEVDLRIQYSDLFSL